MSHPIFDLLNRPDEASYHYILERDREDAITVEVSFVGERVEVDVFEDGHMEVSRFLGTEDALGGQELIYQILDNAIFEDKMYEKRYEKKQE